jgi:hypothetical protein
MAASIERSTFPKALLVAAMSTACFFAAPSGAVSIGAAAQAQTIQPKDYPYYIEFRVAVDGVYGHSYIAYGRLDSLGRPMTTTYADIHPTGDLPSMVLGHLFPMEAATIPEKDTLHYEIASHFRQPLTAAEYGTLQSVIDHIRAAHHSWSVLAYNCNDFVADVARGIGMQSPSTLLLPYDFIPRLQVINERGLRPISALAFTRVTEVRQSGQSADK